ncbi:MAG: hypothetical protein INH37_04980 [Myxococcaceae bacterium]|jgi:hypothetical protein|nr:hypothetical protein [Myxococcaceae bacterium]
MRSSPSPIPSRIPTSHLEKALHFLELARSDVEAGRLQSAESFLRLAAAMDPSNRDIVDRLRQVTAARASERQPFATEAQRPSAG